VTSFRARAGREFLLICNVTQSSIASRPSKQVFQFAKTMTARSPHSTQASTKRAAYGSLPPECSEDGMKPSG
jgi:hypothetical protein